VTKLPSTSSNSLLTIALCVDHSCYSLAAFGQGLNETVQAVPANQIIGPNDPTNPGGESTLDIEMIAGVNLGATNWFWLENGNGWYASQTRHRYSNWDCSWISLTFACMLSSPCRLYQFGVHFFSTADVPQVRRRFVHPFVCLA
jgi:hypothetical protein